jgi:hypothetical protein
MISNIYTKFQQVSSPQITVFIDLKQNTAASQGFSKQPNLSSFNKYRNPIQNNILRYILYRLIAILQKHFGGSVLSIGERTKIK